MITEQDLLEAIAECQGQKNPNANTCIKLAAFLTIQKALYGDPGEKEESTEAYSFSGSYSDPFYYTSDTEFGQAIMDKDLYNVVAVIDELMTTLQVINPKLYNSVMRRI